MPKPSRPGLSVSVQHALQSSAWGRLGPDLSSELDLLLWLIGHGWAQPPSYPFWLTSVAVLPPTLR